MIMQVKKNPRYNLEKKRVLFLQFGFLISFLFVLMAFEYKVPMNEPEDFVFDSIDDMEELTAVTFREPEKKMEPPKVRKIELIDLLVIEEEPEEEYIPEDSFGDPNEEILKQPAYEEEISEEMSPFVSVEEMPIFNPQKNKTYEEGCKDLFITMQRMVRYPIAAQESNIHGKVFVKFVVTSEGNISNIQVTRKVDPLLDEEVVRVVQNLPKFKPGKQFNKKVPVWFSGYINFVLQ
ncbi:TonB family protein [Labilibaculum sp. 44]|uniref:TonB family protein n=2 Tax=Labilibaculum euxinus TaxID=2686357 RepID=A0A425Y3J7_9BACT|nr:TonB family protein [Labilibaculum euxinus]MVB08973.1 TonB family protein [Labilibaculum euxinus]